MIKKKKSRKRKDYDLLKGSANTMNYISWRYSPKFHSKALLERFKMNNTIRCQVLEKYNHQCVICGSKKDLQIDHIIPLSKGGKTTIKNLQVLCKKCNAQKHDKTLEEFMKWKKEHE